MRFGAMLSMVFRTEVFLDDPLTVIDIGASGGPPRLLRPLAPYVHYIGFDPDARDRPTQGDRATPWQEFTMFDSIADPEWLNENALYGKRSNRKFFLTAAPHCSSTLRPDEEKLAPWEFSEMFEVVDARYLPATSLPDALKIAGVAAIDWFKCDSQGTDLRLWASLPAEAVSTTAVASFEPGIIDAYLGEDKLHQVLQRMDDAPFYLARMEVRGSRRVPAHARTHGRSPLRRAGLLNIPRAPGWAELWYLRDVTREGPLNDRTLFVIWVAATLLGEHGYAWLVADMGLRANTSNAVVFDACRRFSESRWTPYSLRTLRSALRALGRRYI